MPLPRLAGTGSMLGGLANALGLGLEGYAKDQATAVERERNRQKDLGDAQMLAAQLADHKASVDAREAATRLTQQKVNLDHASYLRLAQDFPQAITGPEVEGGGYTDTLVKARAQKQADAEAEVRGRATLSALGSTFPKDPDVQQLVKAGWSPGLVDALPKVWESAQKRYDLANAYHAPPAGAGLWAHDTTTNTDVYVTKDQLTSAAPGRYVKPGAAGGGSGSGSLSPTAIQGMYDDLGRLDGEMSAYEKAHPNGVGLRGSLLGPMANQKTPDLKSAVGKMVGNWGLGVADSDYQKYIQNNARAGNIISQINSKRGTEYQSLLDIEQTGQAPGDAAGTVASKQLVRANALAGRPKPPPGYVPVSQRTEQATTPPAASPNTPPAAAAAPAPGTAPPPTTNVSQMTDRQLWDAKARTPQGLKWLTDHHMPRPAGP